MKKIIGIGILTLLILALFIGVVYIFPSRSHSVTTTYPSNLLTTIPSHVLPYPPRSIDNFTYTLTTSFPISAMPYLSHGYIAGDMYTYEYMQNTLALRFLAYNSIGAAFNAYKIITNYTLNSTTIPLSSLPVNYSGVKIYEAGAVIYSISGLYVANVLTATLVQPSNSSMTTANATSFLLNALQQLINSSA